MSGRVRWMISATARAWALTGVERSRRRAPSEARLRLQLKVAMRIRPDGRSAAAAGKVPTAARMSNARTLRTSARRLEVEANRRRHRARCADGEEADRGAARARADGAEVLFVEQVGHVQLQLGALEARQLEAVVQVDIDHGVTRRNFVIEVGGEPVVHLLRLDAGMEVFCDVDIHASGVSPLR